MKKEYTYQDLIDYFEGNNEVQFNLYLLKDQVNCTSKQSTLEDVLDHAFPWHQTPQRYSYWNNICKELKSVNKLNQ